MTSFLNLNSKNLDLIKPLKISLNEIYTVNFHFWPYCNYRCKFCFATFKNSQPLLSKREIYEIIYQLHNWGVRKINFAGGEPTLCPYLGDLLNYSKKLGLITSIISNGTGITENFLKNFHNSIDWLGFSIESGKESTELLLGRGNGHHVSSICKKVELLKKYPINLKINTVVTSHNFREDLNWLIDKLQPERWKVFQILPIKDENETYISNFIISETQFEYFIQKHKQNNPIPENNNLMQNSYIMIDSNGRFFQSVNNQYFYSYPILEVGIETAFKQITWDKIKFQKRGGNYNWNN